MQTRQLGAVVVEIAHHIGELLLGCDHHPHLAPAFHTQLLHDRLKIEHLLNVAGHVLAHFIHHKHQLFAGMLALHQLNGAFGQAGGCDRYVLITSTLEPAVFLGIGLRFEGVHHRTGPWHRLNQARF